MYLTRNHQEKCVAARVMRETKLHSQYFTLKEYGSWEDAERAGKRWLRELLPTLPPKMSSKDRMTRRNHSGVVGVYWTPGIVRKPNGREYSCPRWVARWPGCKFTGGLSWSVIQFDDNGAFVLAVLSRKRETIDREVILSEWISILDTKEFSDICALKKVG